MDAASLTVSINGDASGLIGAAESAKAALSGLASAAEGVKGLDGLNAAVTVTANDNASPVVQAASAAVTAFSGITGRAALTAVDNTGPGVASAKANIASVQGKTVTITVNYVTTGAKPKAKGTKNFEGGLALVNDERGARDPRELIVDRGMAFIPEGRNVLLPLSKGAKVYTADETKGIMASLGIPSYAAGKDNSDAYKIAEADIRHLTKSRALTNAEELERWVGLSAEFTDNIEDAKDIEENIFSLTRKISDELNDESKAYLSDRAYFNDFWINGDSPVASFERVRDRNYRFFEDGVISWQEYCDNVSEIGSFMYEERLEHSYDWLEQEREYNNLSSEDYIAGLERMRDYTREYYSNGIISFREYSENMQDIDNAVTDELRARAEAEAEAAEAAAKAAEKAAEEAHKARIAETEELLDAQKDYINRVEDRFAAEEKALRDSWESADRRADIAETEYRLSVYSGAVTEKGREKYNELREQMKKLRREEEMYRIEQENNAVIADLRADYEVMEKNKAEMMLVIEDTGIDVSGVVSGINREVAGVQEVIRSIAADIIAAINAGAGTTYSDRRTINVTAADSVMLDRLISRGGSAMARGAYY